jgi:pyrroline-5-carboxylate reductase
MLTKKTIGFIGAGNIGEALIKGLLKSKMITPAQIIVADKNKERLANIAENYDIKVFNKSFEVAKTADIIILTVKPVDVKELLKEISPDIGKGKLLISSIAGITTDYIRQGLYHPLSIVRVMPNTPVLIQEGAIGLYTDKCVTREDRELSIAIFELLGKVVIIESEELMNAVTGLSGSGPAYFFFLLEAFVDAGVSVGLPRDKARVLSMQTALGSIKLAIESSKHLSELKEMVASPGGTTIAGLTKLEECETRSAIIQAVKTATKKAKDLAK